MFIKRKQSLLALILTKWRFHCIWEPRNCSLTWWRTSSSCRWGEGRWWRPPQTAGIFPASATSGRWQPPLRCGGEGRSEGRCGYERFMRRTLAKSKSKEWIQNKIFIHHLPLYPTKGLLLGELMQTRGNLVNNKIIAMQTCKEMSCHMISHAGFMRVIPFSGFFLYLSLWPCALQCWGEWRSPHEWTPLPRRLPPQSLTGETESGGLVGVFKLQQTEPALTRTTSPNCPPPAARQVTDQFHFNLIKWTLSWICL